jgi:hypothetical protein
MIVSEKFIMHKLDRFASFAWPVVCQLRMLSAKEVEEEETKDDMQNIIKVILQRIRAECVYVRQFLSDKCVSDQHVRKKPKILYFTVLEESVDMQ